MTSEVPSAELVSDVDSATEPTRLVEHFFRHESAKLIAVLTRAFGLGRLDLVEDKVQDALMAAVSAWRQRGIPQNPGGWIYRVARNRILDELRREKLHERVMALGAVSGEPSETVVEEWLSEDHIPDSLLRMMFVCCHPALDRRSQISMTLKILCGFSVAEIARGLLMSPEATKKRIQRAKKTLADLGIRLEVPPEAEMATRLAAVHEVLYLMFNEGYSTTHGIEPLRDDVCEEAARLCHLLCAQSAYSTPESCALLALMLFHAARLESRVDGEGRVVLLEDQDRSQWDRGLLHIACTWFDRSRTNRPSRFHYEAAIALEHCRAPSVAATDWGAIVTFYDRLLAIHPSSLYVLNRAIARGQSGDVDEALREIDGIRDQREMRGYALLDCAAGRLHELKGDRIAASEAYEEALRAAVAPHERAVIERRLAALTDLGGR